LNIFPLTAVWCLLVRNGYIGLAKNHIQHRKRPGLSGIPVVAMRKIFWQLGILITLVALLVSVSAGAKDRVRTTTPVTTAVTTVPQPKTSTISVYSSPLNAAVLIDGNYIGTTPMQIPNISSGYHLLKLSLSGYTDYDSKIFVIAGQDQNVFGTLQPIGQIIARETPPPITTLRTPLPVNTVVVTPTPAVMENPGVIAAIIGVIAATIGAVTTIFVTVKKKD
jgi:hypothetical protein